LTKPGPATSAAATSASRFNSAAIRSARARGFSPAGFARTIATLVARSPCEASRGGSTAMRDRSSAPPSFDFRSIVWTIFLIRSSKSAKIFIIKAQKISDRAGYKAPENWARPSSNPACGQTNAGVP
jgi:hypothetical protein